MAPKWIVFSILYHGMLPMNKGIGNSWNLSLRIFVIGAMVQKKAEAVDDAAMVHVGAVHATVCVVALWRGQRGISHQ
jgi:hypothetical protein